MPQSNRYLSWSISGLSALALSSQAFAFGRHAPAPTPSIPHTPVANIQFDASIPDDQYQHMTKDLADLQEFQFSHPDSKLLSVMGLPDASSNSMLNWLQDRVHYVVSETFNFSRQTVSRQKGYAFQNPAELPQLDLGDGETVGFSLLDLFFPRVVIVMANTGAGYYVQSKMDGELITVRIPGVADDIAITSPRTGIIQIGKGLFETNLKGLQDSAPDSKARFAYRMSVFFHEARHSDGNGKHIAFFHSVCPKGHPYEGSAACDKNLNGPYTVGAHFLNSMALSCKECSPKETEILKTEALDSLSRVIPQTVSKAASDPKGDQVAKLRILTLVVHYCEESNDMELGTSVPKSCANLDKIKQQIEDIKKAHTDVTFTDSTDWDPTPEGV